MAENKVNAAAAYESYASGQKTINDIADEYHVEAFVVTEAIEQFMAHREPAPVSQPQQTEQTEDKTKPKDKK